MPNGRFFLVFERSGAVSGVEPAEKLVNELNIEF